MYVVSGVSECLCSVTVGLIHVVVCLHFVHLVPLTVRKYWSCSNVLSLAMSVYMYEQSTCIWFLGALNIIAQSELLDSCLSGLCSLSSIHCKEILEPL